MAEVAVINHETENFDTGLLCFETSCQNNGKFDESTHSSRMHRKHRFTIFIGYGDEAGCLLKRFEQLKCKLAFSTNIQFLTYLIDFFEQYNTEYATNLPTVEISDDNYLPEGLSSYVYDVKCKTFKSTVNLNPLDQNETLSSNIVLAASNSNEVPPNSEELHKQINPIDADDTTNIPQHKHAQELCVTNEQTQHLDTEVRKAPELTSAAAQEYNAMADITSPVKRKSEHMDENIGINCNTVSVGKVMCQSSAVDVPLAKPDFDTSLITLSDVNTKVLMLIHQYMENIKNDVSYCYGYISCSQKLKSFLDEYRFVTSTAFTVRSSRSYIKKRVLTALKSSKNENNAMSALNTSIPNMSCIGVTDHNDNMLTSDIKLPIKLPNQISDGEMKGIADNSFEVTRAEEAQDTLLDEESMVTGPLRWEFILGKPPIPFTGVPFFIIGNTQYQCLYASPDIRTQRRKEKIEQIRKENPDAKTRSRRSMKRDCKAVMCIKSIVTFPEFSIVDKMQSVNSKKGCRKLKAMTLDNLRQAVERGESIGHPSFWVHIPLPEAHSTHDVVDTCTKLNNNSNMDEIAHLLQLAAYQYSGQEKGGQCDENVARVKLKNT